MSKRNTKAAKARRRAQRAQAARRPPEPDLHALVDVKSWDELVGLAHRGECLPCGCDAHALLHRMLRERGPRTMIIR